MDKGEAETWDEELKAKCDAAMPRALVERRRTERLNAQAPAMYALLKDMLNGVESGAIVIDDEDREMALREILAAVEGE
jgi:hypothetical protein